MSNNEQTSTKKKSKYQKTLARKRGKGRINPNWMWWYERS